MLPAGDLPAPKSNALYESPRARAPVGCDGIFIPFPWLQLMRSSSLFCIILLFPCRSEGQGQRVPRCQRFIIPNKKKRVHISGTKTFLSVLIC